MSNKLADELTREQMIARLQQHGYTVNRKNSTVSLRNKLCHLEKHLRIVHTNDYAQNANTRNRKKRLRRKTAQKKIILSTALKRKKREQLVTCCVCNAVIPRYYTVGNNLVPRMRVCLRCAHDQI